MSCRRDVLVITLKLFGYRCHAAQVKLLSPHSHAFEPHEGTTMNAKPFLFVAIALACMHSSIGLSALAPDVAGKCRDNGKFVAAELCKTPTPAAPC